LRTIRGSRWTRVLTEIKNSGVSGVLTLVRDGLKGLPGAAAVGRARSSGFGRCCAPRRPQRARRAVREDAFPQLGSPAGPAV
jgi:hypothetical protein